MKRFITFVLAIALGSLAHAEVLVLKDGTRLTGKATAYDSNVEVLSWETAEGEALRVPLVDLRASSAYRVLKGQVEREDAEGQLQLGNFARDIEFFAHAGRHYGYAEAADATLKPRVAGEVALLKRRAATWAMAHAKEAIADGNLKRGEDWLEKILTKLPDQPEAAEARRMLDAYFDRVHREGVAEVEREHREVLEKGLSKAKSAYDEMLVANKAALQSEQVGGKAVRSWEKAISQGERAIKELDRFEKENPEAYKELLSTYRSAVDKELIGVHLHLATHWASRNSYNKALVHTNRALAIDPNSDLALGMRNRIIDASSRGNPWVW